MKTKLEFSFRSFVASNGLLRCLILILGLIVIGLAAGDFTSNTPETYFMIMAVLCFLLALATTVLSSLELFKNERLQQIDAWLETYASLFLLNSSIAKLISTSVNSATPLQVISAVFGLINSVFFGYLGYLTNCGKPSFPCTMASNEVNEVDEDIKIRTPKSKPVLVMTKPSSNENEWSWRKALTCQLIAKRVKWSLVFDGSTKQARLFTLIIGLIILIFAPATYIDCSLSEHYFITVTFINFIVTFFLHMFYLLGISQIKAVKEDLGIFDKSFHITSGLFLLVGGILMLGSTIESSRINRSLIQERTLFSVFGILNGILYGYIGLRNDFKWKVIPTHPTTNPTNTTTTTSMTINKPENKVQQLPSMDEDPLQRPSLIFDPSKV